VTSAARADRQTQRHRLQAARIRIRQLEAFDMHGPIGTAAAGCHRSTPRAFGQQRTDTASLSNRGNGGQDALCVAEAQSECPRLGQQAFLDSLDRPRERASGADRVEPVVVA